MLFDIDAAAISLVFDGASTGTLGSSGASARVYDELQFTLGEGPCLASVTLPAPVLVAPLADPADARWPASPPPTLSHPHKGRGDAYREGWRARRGRTGAHLTPPARPDARCGRLSPPSRL